MGVQVILIPTEWFPIPSHSHSQFCVLLPFPLGIPFPCTSLVSTARHISQEISYKFVHNFLAILSTGRNISSSAEKIIAQHFAISCATVRDKFPVVSSLWWIWNNIQTKWSLHIITYYKSVKETRVFFPWTKSCQSWTQTNYTNRFQILSGPIAWMSGLPAYMNRNDWVLFMSCGPLYSTTTCRSIPSYDLLVAVGDITSR